MKRRTWLLTVLALGISAGVGFAADFGDYTSSTLTGKAWAALQSGQYDVCLTYINKCKELYEAEALKQQASLTAFAPKERGHDYWALNDVGTCYFIEAEVLGKQDKKAEQIEVLRKLSTQFSFCQCWDNKGWFWHPAEAAAAKLKQLEFDAGL